MRTRLLVGALGVAMGSFGALRFLQFDYEDIVDAVLWLAGGVVVHDAIVAPLTLLVTLIAGWLVPAPARARVLVGLVVLATVTVTAIPVLGRWGARPDNRHSSTATMSSAGWCSPHGCCWALCSPAHSVGCEGGGRDASAGQQAEQQAQPAEDDADCGQHDGRPGGRSFLRALGRKGDDRCDHAQQSRD
jgi:hypothetical protein